MGILSRIKGWLKTAGKALVLHHYYPSLYRKAAKREINPRKVVFLEIREAQLSDAFSLLWKEMSASDAYEVCAVCIREGQNSYAHVVRLCREAIGQLADASWILVNDSSYFLSSLPLRPQTQVIQLWHACGAFKKFGYSTAEKRFGTDTSALEQFPVHRNMTYVTVSSPEVAWAYAEAFRMDESRMLATGISRTDVFYDPEQIALARSEAGKILPEGKKIALYAPTFRGKVGSAKAPTLPDFRRLHEVMGPEWIFACKQHPFVKARPQIPEEERTYVFDVTEKLTIEQLLMISDLCISDYSSLVFEYALFERPMVFYAPDLDEYGDWRGFYYPYRELTPGPVVQSMDELVACLSDIASWFSQDTVHAFRQKFMGCCDGHATERIVRLVSD